LTLEELRGLVNKLEDVKRKAPDDFDAIMKFIEDLPADGLQRIFDEIYAELEAALEKLPPEVAERVRLASRAQRALVALTETMGDWQKIKDKHGW
jgi:uncharacterized coiled-coil protein SlyX